MRIMAIGDIVSSGGTAYVKEKLWGARDSLKIDMVIANGENAAEGNGIDIKTAEILFGAGVDVITTGNHVWHKKEIYSYIDRQENLLRPANYPSLCPGNGYVIYNMNGYKVLVISLLGTVFMEPVNSPFECADRILEREKGGFDIAIVDFHAEATSEKAALANYLDGRITALFGTHTHVMTADARVLRGGTGFITDVGMTGVTDSVLGVNKETIIGKFLTKMPQKFLPAEGQAEMCTAVFDIDPSSFKTLTVETVKI